MDGQPLLDDFRPRRTGLGHEVTLGLMATGGTVAVSFGSVMDVPGAESFRTGPLWHCAHEIAWWQYVHDWVPPAAAAELAWV